jgi:hypothetical protein
MAMQDADTDRRMIPWPDTSLSYVFCCDPQKQRLQNLIHGYRSAGVTCKYPFRERADPTVAGVLLEGPRHQVQQASREIGELFHAVAAATSAVQVVLSDHPQYAQLAADDMGEINYIQSSVGVHIVLDYKGFDSSSQLDHKIESVIDLRFAVLSLLPSRSPPPPPPQEDQELISVCFSSELLPSDAGIIVSIISTNSSDVGWTWGVNALLVLLDCDEDSVMGFSAAERSVLNSGGVLVHKDAATNKTILQVQPNVLVQRAGEVPYPNLTSPNLT